MSGARWSLHSHPKLLSTSETGQRGRNCTCDHPVPGRACCCYTTRCLPPARSRRAPGDFGSVGGRTRRPWTAFRGEILRLNHSRRKLKGPGATGAPGPCMTTKNKHHHRSAPVRGRVCGHRFFAVVLSVFGAHLPSPLECKFVVRSQTGHPGVGARQHAAADGQRPTSQESVLAPGISLARRAGRSCHAFRSVVSFCPLPIELVFPNKKPCLLSVSRVGKVLLRLSLPAYLQTAHIIGGFGLIPLGAKQRPQAAGTTLDQPLMAHRHDCRGRRPGRV